MSKFIDAILGKNYGKPPVFMMRQAGRYHSHYRKIKEQHTFEQICKSPKLAGQVALGPVEAFGFDAGILFSDILFILETIGYNVIFNPGPKITQANICNTLAMEFQVDAILETKKLLGSIPLIGFVGGLATVHHFLVECGNCKAQHIQLHNFIEEIQSLYIENIMLQVRAGASCIAIFDSKAANQTPDYWKSVQNIINLIRSNTQIPIIYYSKETLEHEKLLGISCFGYSSGYNIVNILQKKNQAACYGNFDEKTLAQNFNIFKLELNKYLTNILQNTTQDTRKHWVASIGHGISKETPEANILYFIQAVQDMF